MTPEEKKVWRAKVARAEELRVNQKVTVTSTPPAEDVEKTITVSTSQFSRKQKKATKRSE